VNLLNLYLIFGGFLVIALLWAILLFCFLHWRFKIKKKSLITVLFIFIGIGIIIFLATAVIEYTESPEFCGEFCHPRADLIVHDEPMKPFLDSYEHPDNNTMMASHLDNDVTCSNCHDAPGLYGKIEAYSKSINEIYRYVTGDYDPDDLGGHVKDENCLKCHDGEIADKASEIKFENITFYPHEEDQDCVECHTPHEKGIGLSDDSCLICHEIEQEQLDNHAKTTEGECMDCHNRLHPDNAYIPFSQQSELITDDFCSDCHEPEFNAVSKWSDYQVNLYGDCTSTCHKEHYEKNDPHTYKLTRDDYCNECHTTGVASHNPIEISFMNFSGEIYNTWCTDCHTLQFDAYKNWTIGQKLLYGSCASSCHFDHRETVVPHITTGQYAENCDQCHLEDIASHKVPNIKYSTFSGEIRNEFCQACHSNEFESLKLYNHSRRQCLDCHLEHNIIRVDFDECSFCHEDIPTSHDEEKTDCAECHNIDVIHDRKYGDK
jgi:hypothetical protein